MWTRERKKRKRRRKKKQVGKPKCLPPWESSSSPLKSAKSKRRKGMKERRRNRDMEG
jgi:hypothetical protein